MQLNILASKLLKITNELRRPNLTTEDKGNLVKVKDKLTEELTTKEQEAKIALETMNKSKIENVEYKFNEAKKTASEYSKALQVELLNVQKGLEAIERASRLIEKYSRAMQSIKSNESNRVYPHTSQTTIFMQTQHIKTSIVSDFFKALNVNFKNIDQYKGYFLSHGLKKENVNELIKRLSEMKLSKPDIPQWYLENHSEKSQISQDVRELMKEDL